MKRERQWSGAPNERSTWAKRLTVVASAAVLCASAFAVQAPEPPKPPDDETRQLAEKLKRKASTGAEEDLMDAIIRLMDESARRIEFSFDAGDDTQSLQRQVVDKLDEAIKIAASQRRPKRSRRPPSGDKRRMAQPDDRPKEKSTAGQQQAGASATTGELPPGTAPKDGKTTGGSLEESRRTWGHLPLRDREALIQGSGEAYLERYREWIERYYRALQESDQ